MQNSDVMIFFKFDFVKRLHTAMHNIAEFKPIQLSECLWSLDQKIHNLDL